MVSVSVSLVVHWDNVHQHDVLGVLVHPGERDSNGWKHPPNGVLLEQKEIIAELKHWSF